jgi:hypothetical protein
VSVSVTHSRPHYPYTLPSLWQMALVGMVTPDQLGGLLGHPAAVPDPAAGAKGPIRRPATQAQYRTLHAGVGVLDRAPTPGQRTGGLSVVFSNDKSVSLVELLLTPHQEWAKRAADRRAACVAPVVEETMKLFTVGKAREPARGGYAEQLHHLLSAPNAPQDHVHVEIINAAWGAGDRVQSVRNFGEAVYGRAALMNAESQKLLSDHYARQGLACVLEGENCRVAAVPRAVSDLMSDSRRLIQALKDEGVVPDTRRGADLANYHARVAAEVRIELPKDAKPAEVQAAWLRVIGDRAHEAAVDLHPVAQEVARQRAGPSLAAADPYEDKAAAYEAVRAGAREIETPLTKAELEVRLILASVPAQRATLASVRAHADIAARNPRAYGLDTLSLRDAATGAVTQVYAPPKVLAEYARTLLDRREEGDRPVTPKARTPAVAAPSPPPAAAATPAGREPTDPKDLLPVVIKPTAPAAGGSAGRRPAGHGESLPALFAPSAPPAKPLKPVPPVPRGGPREYLPVPSAAAPPARVPPEPPPRGAPPPAKLDGWRTRVKSSTADAPPGSRPHGRRTWRAFGAKVYAWLKDKFGSPELTKTISAGREVEWFLDGYSKGSKRRSHAEAVKAMLFRTWSTPDRVAEAGERRYREVRACERLRPGSTLVVDDRAGRLTEKQEKYLARIAERDGAKLEVLRPRLEPDHDRPAAARDGTQSRGRHSPPPPPPPPEPPPGRSR